jgi:hypothetical protein
MKSNGARLREHLTGAVTARSRKQIGEMKGSWQREITTCLYGYLTVSTLANADWRRARPLSNKHSASAAN